MDAVSAMQCNYWLASSPALATLAGLRPPGRAAVPCEQPKSSHHTMPDLS